MPKTFTKAQRESAIAKVVAGLRKGTPLTVICSGKDMPCDDTIRNWADDDAGLRREIARARDAGFDTIAMEALVIADGTTKDTVKGENGEDRPNSEWIARSRLRVETRLKLLAKWDPKRYGDRQLVGSDPDNPLPAGFTVTFRDAGGG